MPESEKEEEPFTSRFAGVKIDWPRTIGYYGAVAAAVAFDIIAPPLGAFIAVVPLLKFVKRPNAPPAERFLAAILEGAGKPVGGDAEGVLRPAWIDDAKENGEAEAQTKELGHGGQAAPSRDATVS